jgi:catechol 2,3-dioxygenase-like lactoylglutathione lyase family enzyme
MTSGPGIRPSSTPTRCSLRLPPQADRPHLAHHPPKGREYEYSEGPGHHHNANQGEKFEESHTGLDHISFQVADRAALEAWIDRLDELNIGHTGIRRRPNGPYATVVFRDPDNNQLEFAAPMPTDA